jgi:Adenylate and Guanylate cyclase catalytic domain/Double zinc ribbon
MKCPGCQSENPGDAKLCVSCGKRFKALCPNCGSSNSPAFRFCKECCQAMLKPAEIRPIDYSRPQSYLHTEVPGGEDPRHAQFHRRRAEARHRALCRRGELHLHRREARPRGSPPDHGRLLQDPDGRDSPVRGDDQPVHRRRGHGPLRRAPSPRGSCPTSLPCCTVHSKGYCGLRGEDQRPARDRVQDADWCLNSGPVVVDSIGDDLRMDYTAVGDTTNLASRLQHLASPGSVLVSSHTYRLTRDFFEFRALGEIPVKGKDKRQEAYQLLRVGEVSTRFAAAQAKGQLDLWEERTPWPP